MPAVQKPHWSAWLRLNADCRTPRRSAEGASAFDCAHLAAFDLHGECEAGPRRLAVDGDGAGAAHAVFAPNMRARHPDLMPQEVGQQHPRLGFTGAWFAVEHEADGVALTGWQSAHGSTSRTRSRPIMRTRSRRYRAVAWTSSRASSS